MTLEQFWQYIDALRAAGSSPFKPEPYRKRITSLFNDFQPAQAAWFMHRVDGLLQQLRTRQHWLAANLAFAGACDDDAFAAFRAWIIAHGRDAFDRVLANPDQVATLGIELDRDGDPMPSLNPLLFTPRKIFEKMTRNNEAAQAAIWDNISADERARHEPDFHVGWSYWEPATQGELESKFPALWAAFGGRYQKHLDSDEYEDPLAGFVKQANVAGLGDVGIGDTLISRYDGSSFVVLGISDTAAIFAGAGAEHGAGDDFRYIARVKDENGEIHSGQGLSGKFQRRPGDPDIGLPEDDHDHTDASTDNTDWDSYEARDELIQARVKAALGDDVRVIYSAYQHDDDELPIDNLDERAHKGKIRFIAEDPNDGETFESEVLDDPTWLDIARVANLMLIALGDTHHVYLEGIDIFERPKGRPAVAGFAMGS